MENQIGFKRKIYNLGGSRGVTFPQELIEFLKLNEGDTIRMIGQEKSKGKFIALWKEKKEK